MFIIHCIVYSTQVKNAFIIHFKTNKQTEGCEEIKKITNDTFIFISIWGFSGGEGFENQQIKELWPKCH